MGCNRFEPLTDSALLGLDRNLSGPPINPLPRVGPSEASSPLPRSFAPKNFVKLGGKSKKSKCSPKSYASARDTENLLIDMAMRKGKSVVGPDLPFSANVAVPLSSSEPIGKPSPTTPSFVSVDCRATSAAADIEARVPVLSGLDAEQSALVA